LLDNYFFGDHDGGMSDTRKGQSRTELSTRLLLEATADLVVENGWERTTLGAIGRRAGYSHGLVTQRFGSKDGLLHALLDRMTTQWATTELAPRMPAERGVESVCLFLSEVRASAVRDPRSLRALYALMFEGLRIDAIRDDLHKTHVQLRSALAEAFAAQEGRGAGSTDPQIAAARVVAVLRGAAYQWMLDETFPFVDVLSATIDDLVAAHDGGERS
jgi:AcrR family transcriptional regulator